MLKCVRASRPAKSPPRGSCCARGRQTSPGVPLQHRLQTASRPIENRRLRPLRSHLFPLHRPKNALRAAPPTPDALLPAWFRDEQRADDLIGAPRKKAPAANHRGKNCRDCPGPARCQSRRTPKNRGRHRVREALPGPAKPPDRAVWLSPIARKAPMKSKILNMRSFDAQL